MSKKTKTPKAAKITKTPDKGTYRSIYSAIWDDPEFQEFDGDMMLVFFSLRTCVECKFFGIFTFYPVLLHERILHIPPERLYAAFDRLVETGWVKYERPILWIVKALKNEPNFAWNNPNHVTGLQNHLGTLPKLGIVEEFAAYYGIPIPCQSHGNPMPIPPEGNGIRMGSSRDSNQGEGDCKSTSTPGAALTAAPEGQTEDQSEDERNAELRRDIPMLQAEVKAGIRTAQEARDNIINRGAPEQFAYVAFPDEVEQA